MGEAEKKDEDEKLIPVGPGAEELEPAEKQEDEKQDARLANDPDEPESEDAKESRHKESARERRDRAKRARERERRTMVFYEKRNEDLEKRLMVLEGRATQSESAAIDQRVTSIHAQLANADRVLAEALRKPNGSGADEFVEAQRIRDELRDQLGTLKSSKVTRESEAAAPRPVAKPESARPDPDTIRHAREWVKGHDWFDFQGDDEESRIVRAIDERLNGDGFDPATPEYWEELTERVKRRLPERFKNGAKARADDEDSELEDERPKASGPKFSSGGRDRPLKKGEVYVSAERKDAMKQYGVWEDPVQRNRMLKKYAKWDAEIAASRTR